MLSRRQLQKFAALCDEDLAHLEAQADLLLTMRRRARVTPPVLRLVAPAEDASSWLTQQFIKPPPVKVERRTRLDRRQHAGQQHY